MSIDRQYPIESLLLLGPTGIGKSPLGDTISQRGLLGRRCHHLDFGSELRVAVSGGARSAAYSAKELDFIHGVLQQGFLLENEHFALAVKIISLFLDRMSFSRREHDLLILNGIPRHAGQARDIASIADIRALCVMDCSATIVLSRIHSNVGGDRSERVDDNRTLVEKKLAIFRERTEPLVEYYEKKGSRIYRLDVTSMMTPADAYFVLSSLTSADPPVSLVAEPPER